MPEIVVDGVRYVPADQARAPRIGVGITTRNRPEVLTRAQQAWTEHLPEGAALVIIDDASDTPVDQATYRFDKNAGIARAKNKALELLADTGADHLFLFDDDTWPETTDWWRPYVESPEPHLMYLWGNPVYRDDRIAGHLRPTGCMLYVERRVLDIVGGMDPRFGKWGFEHESWSDRIYNAGLTTMRYQDVPDSAGLIWSCDQHEHIASSVPEQVRKASDPELAEALRDSDAYVPYREPRRTEHQAVALSVLVASVHTRWDTFAPKIQAALYGQYGALRDRDKARVEIMFLADTKSMPLGDKRNRMVQMASGEYVVFVDDDDRVSDDYLTAILGAIDDTHPDVVTFKASVSIDGHSPRPCIYSKDWEQDHNTAVEYRRLPNHICAVRRELALASPFPSVRYGEDADYAARLKPLLRTQHAIDRVLYHYDYDRTSTETQLADRYRQVIVNRSQPPVVDVVILARSDSDELAAMTQHTIDTCRAGAGTKPVNIVVVEQAPKVRHRDAITMHQLGAFAYNRFANLAAATGSAPWLMVANNDLEFEPGWLDALLDADHAVVSPHNPGDSRQGSIDSNETGTTNGRHFSGWCFMVKRTLWETIGGFDEDFRFWCADDSVIEQVTAAGVQPMLVPASRVRHLTSQTIRKDSDDSGELTWGQVALFEQKYGVRKFEGDPRYVAWKSARGVTT